MALECMVGVRLSAGSPAVKNLVYRSVPGLDHSQRPFAAVLSDSGPPLYPIVFLGHFYDRQLVSAQRVCALQGSEVLHRLRQQCSPCGGLSRAPHK